MASQSERSERSDIVALARPSPRRRRARLPPTRAGWAFLIATLAVGLVAITSGLNLLFFVWGTMVCLVLASGVLSELCLRGLVVRRSPPAVIHAGAPYLMGISVANTKRRLPTFSVEIQDLNDGQAVEKRCYFLKIPAGRTQETAYRHTATRRGRHRFSGFRVSTRFPFGFITKARTMRLETELLVYPALVAVPPAILSGLASRHGRGPHKWQSRRGDFFGLREFRQGDDPRDIHWRTSARRGRPFMRESEDDEGLEVCIVVDNRAADEAAFEKMVSLAASLAVELVRRRYRVGLIARGEEIVPEGGPAQAARILRFLAFVQPEPDATPFSDRVGRANASICLAPNTQPRLQFQPAGQSPDVARVSS